MGTAGLSSDRIVDGRYRIVRPLQRGGMGVVSEAEDLVTGSRVALKLLSLKTLSSGVPESDTTLQRRRELVKRFHREARAAAAVDSEHIVQVLATGTDPQTDEPYIAMEMLDGEDVAQLTKRLTVLRPDAALRIAVQACQGLSKAHRAGIVHRDIKPANLFLAKTADAMTVKLLDFGIAKVNLPSGEDGETTDLTQTGSILGSPQYMSPEQVQGLRSIDARTDIWSLGVVLYRMLSGKMPHRSAEGTGQLLVMICTHPAAPLSRVAPWIPEPIAAIVHRALQIDPEERFASIDLLRDALVEALGSEPTLRDYHLTPLPREALRHAPAKSTDGVEIGDTITSVGAAASSKRAHRGVWWMAGAALVVGAGTLVARAPWSATPSVATQPSATSRDVTLRIAPADAQVTVDGRPVTVNDGVVTLRGSIGDALQVRVSKGKAQLEVRVAIAADGAVPAEVALPVEEAPAPPPEPTPMRPSARSSKAPARPEPRVEPKAAASAPSPWGDELRPSTSLE